jgi:putative ABC transport system permease protein
VIIVGNDIAHGGLSPWNVMEGTAQSLTTPGTVVIDRSYSDQLGVSGVGATAQIRGQPVTVGAVTDGVRSFMTMPYIFSDVDDARAYVGLPSSFTSHFLVRLRPEANIERTRLNILSNIPGIQALTPVQFGERSRSFWLYRTGAGVSEFAAPQPAGRGRQNSPRSGGTISASFSNPITCSLP